METTTATAETAIAASPAQPQPHTSAFRYSEEQLVQLVAALEEPFDPREIKWRVTNTTSDRRRGQVIAYADPRAYTDRLNALFTVRGWTREYSIQVIQNFERMERGNSGARISGKVVVACKLMIEGLGAHSGLGEEWADNENAATAAEAQAFKRACACFGLGRYLYDLAGSWVDLDEKKQPLSRPKLPEWALPKRNSNGRTPGDATHPKGSGRQPTEGWIAGHRDDTATRQEPVRTGRVQSCSLVDDRDCGWGDGGGCSRRRRVGDARSETGGHSARHRASTRGHGNRWPGKVFGGLPDSELPRRFLGRHPRSGRFAATDRGAGKGSWRDTDAAGPRRDRSGNWR